MSRPDIPVNVGTGASEGVLGVDGRTGSTGSAAVPGGDRPVFDRPSAGRVLERPLGRSVGRSVGRLVGSLPGILRSRAGVLVGLAVLAIFVAIPIVGSTGFTYRTLTGVFLLIVAAQGWNLIGGYTGYAAFGNVAFFGIGAYVTAILMHRAALPFLVTLPLAGVVAAAFAVLIGLPVLRLKGHYFAIATLGVAEAIRELVSWATPITDGATGISLPFLKPVDFALNFFYYLALGLVVFGTVLTWLLVRSKLGYSWAAIKADQDGARMLGVNTTANKVIAFGLAAFLTGLAGGVYAYFNSFVAPEEVFSTSRTLEAVLATVLGGVGTIAGPIVGALIFQLFSTFLIFGKPFGIDLGQFHVTILGIFIVLAIVFTPHGLTDLVVRTARGLRGAGAEGGSRLAPASPSVVRAVRGIGATLAQNIRQYRV